MFLTLLLVTFVISARLACRGEELLRVESSRCRGGVPALGDVRSQLPDRAPLVRAEGYPARAVFDQFAEGAKREGWRYYELATGHDCHVEMADAFSRLLVEISEQG